MQIVKFINYAKSESNKKIVFNDINVYNKI